MSKTDSEDKQDGTTYQPEPKTYNSAIIIDRLAEGQRDRRSSRRA